MGCKTGRLNKTFPPQGIFIVTPSLERWPTKAREATSLHELRLTPLDTHPVFPCLRDKLVMAFYPNINSMSHQE